MFQFSILVRLVIEHIKNSAKKNYRENSRENFSNVSLLYLLRLCRIICAESFLRNTLPVNVLISKLCEYMAENFL